MKWLFLGTAIVAEVTGALSMQAAVDQPGWYALVVVGYVAAFAMLILVLRAGMAVGVAYGIWGASGVALTAVLAAVLFGQALTLTMVAGIVLIAAGVLLVEIGSQRALAARKRDAPQGGTTQRGAF
ncbi:QacE family quaternary ammonium compound efflux SMR transporter [Curtobacterium flaccumfaciens pv. oortii]|uniref:DMT family transporter n=1 Tax=Curtobacterium flaccumfaciens TaxID=2035 RepID=UPI001BDF3FFB|nr:SMR family transporter [Curtobacterium flaccumfaciens]MBT1621166.1 QacE family quaternary ammonium compound efflux SMR transporter [Curtobacterium flaccumfaciens pv. oortii]